jgi:periplasmic protein TonB
MDRTSKKMFSQMVEKPKATKKWLFFPLSFMVHGLAVAMVIVFPLAGIDQERPEVKVVDVFLASPPPPATPPVAAAAKRKRRGARKNKESKKKEALKPINTGRPVAPIDVPDTIAENDFDDFGLLEGIPGGVDGGVAGGFEGGVVGAPLLGIGDQPHQEVQVSQLQMPRLIRRIEPIYPKTALATHIQGVVVIEALTDIYGNVAKCRVIMGNPLLRKAAENAVRQWIYEPYILNGVPKPVRFTVTVTFSLQR